MTKQERKSRVVARGENSNHSHVVCGDAVVRNENNEIIVEVGAEGAILKHLLESNYIETGEEIWTEEHLEIPLEKGTYKFIHQSEYNPYNQKIEQVRD